MLKCMSISQHALTDPKKQFQVHPLLRYTRRGPCQHGFMCGCEQWSNNISESNYNMQPITIQFAVRVRKDYTHAPCMFIWAMFGVRGV